MSYLEFKKKIRNLPVFSTRDTPLLGENEQPLRNQLGRWQKKRLLIQLRRGLYLLNEADRKITPSRLFLANQIYGPSYVSLEYALQRYGLIPERVADVTSVTTRKTQTFGNDFGTYIYQHIKKNCFRGFTKSSDEAGLPFFLAEPEKAVVDFLYLNRRHFKKDLLDVLKEGYRFQNISSLRQGKVLDFAALFGNRKLLEQCRQFCGWIREEKG